MAHIAENKWLLNGLDMFTTYSLIISEGSDGLLQPRQRKEPYYNDWAERNGKEYDLSAPVRYHDRTFNLKGFIISTSETDFWAKFNALKAAFDTTGYKTLKCVEIETTVKVFLREMTNVKRFTRIKNSNKIAVAIELNLQEVQ